MPIDYELRSREPLLVPDGPRANDYYGVEIAVGDTVRLSGDYQKLWCRDYADARGTIVEIVPAGHLVDVVLEGGTLPLRVDPQALIRGFRPVLGEVRRSPDETKVAIFLGYRTTWPGRPWHATPAQVLRPQDVVNWTPMKESTS